MKKIFTIIFAVVMVFGLTGCAKKELEEANNDLEATYQKYGTVEKESVNTLVAKLNTEILESELNTLARDDSVFVQDDVYWYALTASISFYLKPVEFTNDVEKDIVDVNALYLKKDEYNEDTALKYVRNLIKANNYDLTEEEITSLISEAKEKSSEGKTSNNGKGVSIGYLDKEDYYEYQVIRLYRN